MKGSPDLHRLKELLGPLLANPDIQLVVLFGSAAGGALHLRSDLDLAVTICSTGKAPSRGD